MKTAVHHWGRQFCTSISGDFTHREDFTPTFKVGEVVLTPVGKALLPQWGWCCYIRVESTLAPGGMELLYEELGLRPERRDLIHSLSLVARVFQAPRPTVEWSRGHAAGREVTARECTWTWMGTAISGLLPSRTGDRYAPGISSRFCLCVCNVYGGMCMV